MGQGDEETGGENMSKLGLDEGLSAVFDKTVGDVGSEVGLIPASGSWRGVVYDVVEPYSAISDARRR